MRTVISRWLSWIWPLRVATAEGHHGPLEVRWERGRRVLNSVQANQSFGSLHEVWRTVFRQAGIAARPPASVLLLGLGGGSVVHILRRELGITTPITAVEIDPVVLALGRGHFGLDTYPGLNVVQGDATVQVHGLKDRYGLVVVDLFDDLDIARGTDSRAFAHGLRERCAADGVVLFNTVAYDETSNARCERVKEHLGRVFHEVEELGVKGINRVFIAR